MPDEEAIVIGVVNRTTYLDVAITELKTANFF